MVSRFRGGGGGLGKKEGVVFLRGVDALMHTMLSLSASVSFFFFFFPSFIYFLCLSSIFGRCLTALEIYFIEFAVPYITIRLTVLLNEGIAFGCL